MHGVVERVVHQHYPAHLLLGVKLSQFWLFFCCFPQNFFGSLVLGVENEVPLQVITNPEVDARVLLVDQCNKFELLFFVQVGELPLAQVRHLRHGDGRLGSAPRQSLTTIR